MTVVEVKIAPGQVVEDHVARWNAMVDRIDQLERNLAAARSYSESQTRAWEGARRNHERDIRLIGEALIEAANEHDWCSEFDEKVVALNSDLVYELPYRKKTWSVDIPFTATYTGTLTRQVEAPTAELAQERALEWVNNDEVDEYVASQVYPDTVELGDTEVEEV